MCSVWSNQCAQCGATSVLSVEQPMCPVWSHQCAHCAHYGAINVLSVEPSMRSLWSNQCAQCGASSVLTVEQSMGSVWDSQCISAHYGAVNMLTVEQPMCSLCGATDVLTVGQPMCLLWSNQCAYCGATNVLTVEQAMCSLWSNQCASRSIYSYPTFTQQCGNQTSQYQINSASCFACSKQKSAVHFQRSYVGCCQGCNSAECYGDGTKDAYMLFSGCVAAYLRGMGTFNCGSSVRLHYWKKVSYYEWQDQVS